LVFSGLFKTPALTKNFPLQLANTQIQGYVFACSSHRGPSRTGLGAAASPSMAGGALSLGLLSAFQLQGDSETPLNSARMLFGPFP